MWTHLQNAAALVRATRVAAEGKGQGSIEELEHRAAQALYKLLLRIA